MLTLKLLAMGVTMVVLWFLLPSYRTFDTYIGLAVIFGIYEVTQWVIRRVLREILSLRIQRRLPGEDA